MPYGYIQVEGKSYKKITAYRAKFMAEGYAATLRLGFTDYTGHPSCSLWELVDCLWAA